MAAAGPGMTTLRSVAARIARTIRCLAIAYVVAQVVIWHSFYAADPWRLAGPVAVVAWAAAMVAYLRRRWPVGQVAGIDSGFHVALALSAGWCVPPAMRGDAANWLYIVMTGQFFIPAWFAPTVVSVPLALASAASYWAGATMTLGTGSAGSSPGASTALLLAIAAANLCARRMLYRRAMGADIALAQADRDAREQYVVLSRNIERREHERLLHDTVLNTLTALTRAGSTDAAGVVGRCRRDVTLMEYVLSDPCDPAKGTGRAYGGLLAAIEAVAIEMRARGLAVHVDVAQGVPAGAGVPGGASAGAGVPAGPGGAPAVPVAVVVAVAHAVREALANVVSHAGTGEAWVDISLAPGGEVAEPGGLQVTVRDAGVGFEPARVDPARLGLRRSIIERIADRGGQASVCSAPGEGTVVSLCWTAWPHPEQDAVVSVTPDRADLTW
jgi:signal transduction histidine kinase